MRSLTLAAALAALAPAAALAQESLGADQGNVDSLEAPGQNIPLFQPDPGEGPANDRAEALREMMEQQQAEAEGTPAPVLEGETQPTVPLQVQQAQETDLTAQVARGGLGNAETVAFLDRQGQEIGSARLVGTPHGLLIGLEVQGLPPSSWVAFHIHETGFCDPATGFDSAGGHYTISDTDHGLLVPTGPHSGDMPNQWVGADGVLRSEVFNTFVQLAESGATVRGRALVLHGGRDDYQSQPSGDAGDRLACAVIP